MEKLTTFEREFIEDYYGLVRQAIRKNKLDWVDYGDYHGLVCEKLIEKSMAILDKLSEEFPLTKEILSGAYIQDSVRAQLYATLAGAVLNYNSYLMKAKRDFRKTLSEYQVNDKGEEYSIIEEIEYEVELDAEMNASRLISDLFSEESFLIATEKRIIYYLITGYTAKGIAEKFNLELDIVNYQLKRIRRKMRIFLAGGIPRREDENNEINRYASTVDGIRFRSRIACEIYLLIKANLKKQGFHQEYSIKKLFSRMKNKGVISGFRPHAAANTVFKKAVASINEMAEIKFEVVRYITKYNPDKTIKSISFDVKNR